MFEKLCRGRSFCEEYLRSDNSKSFRPNVNLPSEKSRLNRIPSDKEHINRLKSLSK